LGSHCCSKINCKMDSTETFPCCPPFYSNEFKKAFKRWKLLSIRRLRLNPTPIEKYVDGVYGGQSKSPPSYFFCLRSLCLPYSPGSQSSGRLSSAFKT